MREQLGLVLEAARRARPRPRPRAALRAARARQDHAGDDHRRRDGRAAAADQRPGDHARRRPGGDPVRPQRGRRALRRRDPPDVAAGRGDALHGDGGLPGRRRHRQGPRRHRDPAGDPAVHAGRRHHPGRAAARARCATGSGSPPTWSSTSPPSWTGSCTARPACSTSSSTGDGAAEIASRSRGTPRIANRLLRRVRDYAQVRADGVVTRDVAHRRAGPLRGRRVRASTGSTAPCSTCCAAASAAARSASRTLAVAVGEERETVEEVAEPFLVRSGFLARTPRGRVATPAAWPHLGPRRPARPQPERRSRPRSSRTEAGPRPPRRAEVRPIAAWVTLAATLARRSARFDPPPPPFLAAREVFACCHCSPWWRSRCCSGCC